MRRRRRPRPPPPKRSWLGVIIVFLLLAAAGLAAGGIVVLSLMTEFPDQVVKAVTANVYEYVRESVMSHVLWASCELRTRPTALRDEDASVELMWETTGCVDSDTLKHWKAGGPEARLPVTGLLHWRVRNMPAGMVWEGHATGRPEEVNNGVEKTTSGLRGHANGEGGGFGLEEAGWTSIARGTIIHVPGDDGEAGFLTIVWRARIPLPPCFDRGSGSEVCGTGSVAEWPGVPLGYGHSVPWDGLEILYRAFVVQGGGIGNWGASSIIGDRWGGDESGALIHGGAVAAPPVGAGEEGNDVELLKQRRVLIASQSDTFWPGAPPLLSGDTPLHHSCPCLTPPPTPPTSPTRRLLPSTSTPSFRGFERPSFRTPWGVRGGGVELGQSPSESKSGQEVGEGLLSRVIVVGDSQSGSQTLRQLLSAAARRRGRRPDLVLHLGDAVQSPKDWHELRLDLWGPLEAENIGSHVATSRVLGNHDGASWGAARDFPWVRAAQTRPWYVVHSGPICIIVLDSIGETMHQAGFLRRVLQRPDVTDAPFRVIAVHIPPFSEYWGSKTQWVYGKEFNWGDGVREHIVPVLEEFSTSIDLVLSGHSHAYQRGERNSIPYIVAGGAGGSFDLVRVDTIHDPSRPQNPSMFDRTILEQHFSGSLNSWVDSGSVQGTCSCVLQWLVYSDQEHILDTWQKRRECGCSRM